MFGQIIAETLSRFNDKRISAVLFEVEMGTYSHNNIQMLPTNVFPQHVPDYYNFNNNIWHLHSLSIDESWGYVLEIRVSIYVL